MNILEIFILALAMAIDALVVSFSYGLIIKENRLKNSIKFATAFGFFQFIMPIMGWFFTSFVYEYIKRYSSIIVFIVFMILGFKFIKEAFEQKEDVAINCVTFSCLIALAILTSIDAFGAGVSIKCLDTGIYFPSIIIGLVTFLLSFWGFNIACCLQKFPSKYIEISGGVLLIYLAIKAII